MSVVDYAIGNISSCEPDMIEIENRKWKIPCKDKWEYCDVIPLLPLLGVNHSQFRFFKVPFLV